MIEETEAVESSSAEPEKQKARPWYSLTPWAMAVGGLVWAIGIIVRGLHSIETRPLEVAVPMTIAALVVGLIMLVVLYGASWLFALMIGRRRVVLSTMFVALVVGVNGAVLALSFSETAHLKGNAEALADLRRLDQWSREQRRQLIESGTTDIDLESYDRVQSQLREIASTSKEDLRLTLEVMLAMNAELIQAAADYKNTLSPVLAQPLLDPYWAESPDDLHAARLAVVAFAAANERLRVARSIPEERVRSEFHARGVTAEKLIVAYIEGSREQQGYHNILRIRETDAELASLLLEACDLYLSRWGTWEYDHDAQSLVFESDEDVAQWEGIYARVQTLVAEQEELKRRIAELPPAAPEPETPAPGGPPQNDGWG